MYLVCTKFWSLLSSIWVWIKSSFSSSWLVDYYYTDFYLLSDNFILFFFVFLFFLFFILFLWFFLPFIPLESRPYLLYPIVCLNVVPFFWQLLKIYLGGSCWFSNHPGSNFSLLLENFHIFLFGLLVLVLFNVGLYLFSVLVNSCYTNTIFLLYFWPEFFSLFIPLFLLIFQLLFSLYCLYYNTIYDNSAMLSIKVTGSQWYWNYQYSDFSVDSSVDSYASVQEISDSFGRMGQVDNCLLVPLGVGVRFCVTSGDIIHSWSLPELAVKIDAVPGVVSVETVCLEYAGVYSGQCSEICGVHHTHIPIVLVSIPGCLFFVSLEVPSGAPLPLVAETPLGSTSSGLLSLLSKYMTEASTRLSFMHSSESPESGEVVSVSSFEDSGTPDTSFKTAISAGVDSSAVISGNAESSSVSESPLRLLFSNISSSFSRNYSLLRGEVQDSVVGSYELHDVSDTTLPASSVSSGVPTLDGNFSCLIPTEGSPPPCGQTPITGSSEDSPLLAHPSYNSVNWMDVDFPVVRTPAEISLNLGRIEGDAVSCALDPSLSGTPQLGSPPTPYFTPRSASVSLDSAESTVDSNSVAVSEISVVVEPSVEVPQTPRKYTGYRDYYIIRRR